MKKYPDYIKELDNRYYARKYKRAYNLYMELQALFDFLGKEEGYSELSRFLYNTKSFAEKNFYRLESELFDKGIFHDAIVAKIRRCYQIYRNYVNRKYKFFVGRKLDWFDNGITFQIII